MVKSIGSYQTAVYNFTLHDQVNHTIKCKAIEQSPGTRGDFIVHSYQTHSTTIVTISPTFPSCLLSIPEAQGHCRSSSQVWTQEPLPPRTSWECGASRMPTTCSTVTVPPITVPSHTVPDVLLITYKTCRTKYVSSFWQERALCRRQPFVLSLTLNQAPPCSTHLRT